MRTRLARVAVSIVAAAGLVWVVPLADVWEVGREASVWTWATALVVFVVGHAANAAKLRLLIGWDRAPGRVCWHAHFAGLAANLGLPGVAGGDVVRAALISPVAGAVRVGVAAILDRMIDAAVLLAIGAAALAVAGRPHLTMAARPVGAVGFIVIVAVTVVFLAGRRLGKRPGIWADVRRVLDELRARPGRVGLAAGTSLAVQTAFVVTHVWLASHVGAPAALAPWAVAWTSAKLSAIVPISVGGLGVRDAALVAVMVAYGASAPAVLAVGLLWDGALIAGSLGGFLLLLRAERRRPRARLS